ncbi:ATP-binding cassette domain-containing protein [Cellvibrio japonicus]|uniref:ATP-binding protein Uup n=1 Tax=Cellvibrio japonicus (strain Ueda107) TaxID=498211 RepID=B3PHL4_CELJU|nr:ATP-binding cassette domain-containing protein [Cellvibrio japonicus]ACE84844.1 ABC transporter, ATP-binding protein [Cellvibrio japonicus Ueda107]QEI12488.1 ATP-binding cassette domain-containing protein [Cellvibrio japonicus]QEI16062.1 ATP-binding cassette domain-containing protein [Cellvibrio japonicus]QEI19640.1 ATP-binding cassette domain-containing protein [Cellvibrio japonicus]
MSLIKIEKAHLGYGLQVILDDVEFNIEKGQRLCLIGRNGTGKSTLLKVIAGEVDLDKGEVIRQGGIRIARLEQDLPEPDDRRVFDVVAAGFKGVGDLLAEYRQLAHSDALDDAGLARMTQLQLQIEAADGWLLQQKVEEVLSRLALPAERFMRELSGGWRRRVALAKALVLEPDVLLLDEPTNHLDIAAIEWLEKQLLAFNGALVFITHDRSLLQALATHIAELDRGRLRYWAGDYASFLVYREQALADEARHNELFDKKLAQEEVWIRQGIKARRTRNEGRVRALKALRDTRAQRREQVGKASFSLASGEASGKLVAELSQVNYRWGDKVIVDNFSTSIVRGDRIGLVGANGAGKSTLLKLILGELEPQSGHIRRGTNLQVAYFDQLRDQLDLDKNAVDNIAEGREFIDVDGKSKHIFSYLSDFLFSGERARTPLRALSGGERNRVLLAKLFSKSANLLVLDEPTNDLDVETLELLEEILTDYEGTVLLVSHDRAFLNNLVSSVIAFEGNGRVLEYVGGYDDWLRQGGRWTEDALPVAKKESVEEKPVISDARSSTKTRKLSYKLQKEFDELPLTIERLEEALEHLQTEVNAPDFYNRAQADVEAKLTQLGQVQQQLDNCFERWAELEDMQQ